MLYHVCIYIYIYKIIYIHGCVCLMGKKQWICFRGNREKTMGFGPKDWGFLRICPPIHKAHNLQRSVTAAAQRILGLSVAAYGL